MDFLTSIGYWHWLIFGILLIALEILMPGSFFLWIGLSALVVGGLSWAFPLPISVVYLLFGGLAIGFTVAGRRYFSVDQNDKNKSQLNRRAEQYIGQHITLSQAIVNNQGRAGIGDSVWRVKGPDLPVNTVVEVVGVEGNTLIVIEILGKNP